MNWELTAQPRYFVGLDLGKAQDHTALAVIERAEQLRRDARLSVSYDFPRRILHSVRHLERVPLMTPYPDIVELVRGVVRSAELERNTTLVVDATGVGAPVVDLLKRAGLRCMICPVMITGGDTESGDGTVWRVPKRVLMVGLQVAFQKRWLAVADCGEATGLFVKELLATRVRVSASGHDRWGAATGHDDLVMAAALAWWRMRRTWGAPR